MKVLLVEPPKAPLAIGGEDVHLFEPLALEYLAAAVAPNHDVEVLDMRIDADLDGVLERFEPDLVGITAYTVHVNVVRRLFAQVKRWNPDIVTVVGGHHATVQPSDFRSPDIDLVVAGDGIATFREVVARLENGRALAGIPGVALGSAGDALAALAPAPLGDLDDCPPPLRSLTGAHRHRYYSEWMRPLASVRTSKGCPFRCSFCAQWKIAGGRYLRRRPELIVDELATIEEPYIFFADDESLVDVKRMERLATLIAEARLDKSFFLYGRSDTIAANPGLVARWRDVGLERVFVGLEFFRDEDLRYVGKRSNVADNDRAVRLLQSLGIDIYASFILRPEFTRDDFAALRGYCRRLDLDFASFAVLTPLPGTDLYAELQGELLVDDFDYFDFIHTVLPTALPLESFYQEYLGLYRRAVPFSKQLALLRRFPLGELPSVMRRSNGFFKRLRTAHLDYAPSGAATGTGQKL